MTQYNSLNVKLSNSQLNKFKSAIKNETEVVLRLSSNMIGDNETNFPRKVLLTNRQVANLRKAFANNLSPDIKLSKTEMSKMIQWEGFLGRLSLGPLLKAGLSLMKNVIKPLAKSVLIPLGLTAVALATDARIYEKILGSGNNSNTMLIISNDEMKTITETVKSLEDSSLLPEGVSKIIQKNETKEQREGFLSMLLGTLSASLLESILASKGINRAGEEVVRVSYGNKKGQKATTKRQDYGNKIFLMLPHPLINFETQKHYQNEPRFNGVYSRDNLPKIKDEAYVTNLHGYSNIGTHWIALYIQNNDVTYFDTFGVEHIPKEIRTFIGNKNIKTNILE